MRVFHRIDASIRRNLSIRRRDFLKAVSASSLAAGAISWSDRMALEASQLRDRGKACIMLWMAGGPSQFETFCPLENHENGGETKAISTDVPGIRIAENLPHMAKTLSDVAIIRSMTSKEGNHGRASFLLHTGYLPTPTVKYPAFGAIAAQQIADPQTELPAYVRIGVPARNEGGSGFLGVKYDPFVHRSPNQPPANTRPTTDKDRYRRRLELLDRLQEDYASSGGADEVRDHRQLYDKAARMILSPQMGAFDLQQEPQAVRQSYGESQFAAGCLLARRLVEAGVTFVEVGAPGWDTHADNFSRTANLAGQIDQPFAQLIADLKRRGMLERTLVVWMGEFGRTPRINGRAGRDHYPRAFSVALAGGGVRGGQVIGRVSADGTQVEDRPVTVPDLFQSFCKSLEINPDRENTSRIGRPIKIVDEGKPVDDLFG